MSKIMALLSGKGGSGKTSLALSITSLLSNCGLKVLLIDCDFATNGATYFYEDKLSRGATDFSSVFISADRELPSPIVLNENASFIPSISHAKKPIIDNINSESCRVRFMTIMKYFRDRYDVIIFDCQAGYSDVLELVLPITDVNLVVMEADAISSAAIRSFYLKCGTLLEKKKIFQVINKATEEEYEIYSKISGGTVFINIETVMFDWKIRKAFAVSQIPDMEKTSARYGEQIYNICNIVFGDDKIKEHLAKYKKIIDVNKLREKAEAIRDEINKIEEKQNIDRAKRKKIIVEVYGLTVASLAIVVFFYIVNINNILKYDNIVIISILVSILAFCFSFMTLYENVKNKKDQLRGLEKKRIELKKILLESNQYNIDG